MTNLSPDYSLMSSSLFNSMLCCCFSYLVMDVVFMPAGDCMMPMQKWLLVSYANVAVFQITTHLGKTQSHAGQNFIFSFRQQNLASRVVVWFTWLMLAPFFMVWTVLGSVWLHRTLQGNPFCSASSNLNPNLLILWQLLSYIWICIYTVYFGIACVVEHRLRQEEKNMSLIETEESLSRWGRLSPGINADYEPFHQTKGNSQMGLQPSEIQALPCKVAEASSGVQCPICLSEINAGDSVRSLPGCSHDFHKSCIDLWLLRRADCPMCKSAVCAAFEL